MPPRLPTHERQAEIVQAALHLAGSSSPAWITTGDIALAVGISQGAVFKHFPSKDAIWLAAMRWVHEALLGALQTAADNAPSPAEALRAMFDAHVDFVIEHPGVPRFIFHELQQAADSPAKHEVRAVLRDYRRLLTSVLARAQPGPPSIDADTAATAFIGLIQGLVMQSMLAGRPAALRQQAAPLFALYWRGIGDPT